MGFGIAPVPFVLKLLGLLIVSAVANALETALIVKFVRGPCESWWNCFKREASIAFAIIGMVGGAISLVLANAGLKIAGL